MVAKALRIEFRKQLPSSGFWILLGLYTVVVILTATNIHGFINNANVVVNDVPEMQLSFKQILQFPDIWQNITYISSYFKIILALIVILSICNEFSSGTAKQNIINGLSRREWLFTKIGLLKTLAIYATLLIIICGILLGISQTDDISFQLVFSRFDYVLAYFFELLTYFVYAMFLSILLKKTGISVILLLVYDFILEPIISWSLPENIARFLPMNAIDNLNRFPFSKYVGMGESSAVSTEQLFWAIGYGILFSAFSYLLLKRQDM